MSIPTDFFDEQLSGLDSARTIFVGDLSYFCNEEDLFTLFAQFGNILTVRVRRGVTGDSLMHGFIAMETTEAATLAISTLDGVEFMGRNIRVQLSSDGQRNSISKDSLVQVHVSFISKQNSFLVTEKILRDIFSPYGAVADVAIKKHVAVPKQGRQSGYGFVYYFDINSAYRALQALKQNTVRDITLDCSISHKSETRIRQTHTPANTGNLPAAPVFDRAQGLIPYPGQAPSVPMTCGAASPPGATSSYRTDMSLPTSALYNTTNNLNRVPTTTGSAGSINGYGAGNQGCAFNAAGIPGGMLSAYPRDHAMSAVYTAANTAGARRSVVETRQHPMAAVYNPTGASYGNNNINTNRLADYNNTLPVNDLSSDFSRMQMSHNSNNNADPRLLSMAAASLTGGVGGPRHTLSSAARHSATSSPRGDTFGLASYDVSPRSMSPRAGYDFLPNDMGSGMLLHHNTMNSHIPMNYPPSGAVLHNDNLSFRSDSLSEYESSFSRSRSRSPRAGSPPLSNINHFHNNNNFDLTSLRHFESHASATSGLNFGALQTLDASGMRQKYNDNVNFLGDISNYDQKQSPLSSDHDGMLLLDNAMNNNNVAAFPSLISVQSPSSFPTYPVISINNSVMNVHPSAGSTTESLSRHSVDSLLSSSSPPTATTSLLQDRQYLLSEEVMPELTNNRKQQQQQAKYAFFGLEENNDKLLESLIDKNETLNE